MSKLEQNYRRLATMCYLLNGRKNDRSSVSYFSTWPCPKEIEIETSAIPSHKRKIQFNRVCLGYESIELEFNNQSIFFDTKKGEFNTASDKKKAIQIFGPMVHPNVVLYYGEKALKEILKEYADKIKEVLTQTAFF